MADKYVAGWNMPGYMPDMDPAEFETCADAREFLASEFERVADALDEGSENDLPEDLDTLHEAAKHLRSLKNDAEYGQTIGQWHYWITTA